MKILKDLNISSLLAEYFKNLESDNLARYSRISILNFLIMISDEKKYRPFIVNKGILMFLKKVFDQEKKDQKTREKIGKVKKIKNLIKLDYQQNWELRQPTVILLLCSALCIRSSLLHSRILFPRTRPL